MLQKYYNARGSIILVDNIKNIVTNTQHHKLFTATQEKINLLVSSGSLSPVQDITSHF